jgi:hypothetical protein
MIMAARVAVGWIEPQAETAESGEAEGGEAEADAAS